jgi:hypothetical protein
MIGFSNGGGAGMFAQYWWPGKVTKVVAIDYWAYADYTNWMIALPDPLGSGTTAWAGMSTAPSVMDAHIYTNCAGGYYKYGETVYSNIHVSDALAVMTPLSYWDQAGMSVLSPGGVVSGVTYQNPDGSCVGGTVTGSTATGGCYPYLEFIWVGPNWNEFTFSTHGFDPSTGYCTDELLGGTESERHSWTKDYVDVTGDLHNWVTTPPPAPPAPPPTTPPITCVIGWFDFLDLFNHIEKWWEKETGTPMNECLQFEEVEAMVQELVGVKKAGKLLKEWEKFDCDKPKNCLDPMEAYVYFQFVFEALMPFGAAASTCFSTPCSKLPAHIAGGKPGGFDRRRLARVEEFEDDKHSQWAEEKAERNVKSVTNIGKLGTLGVLSSKMAEPKYMERSQAKLDRAKEKKMPKKYTEIEVKDTSLPRYKKGAKLRVPEKPALTGMVLSKK